MSSCRVVISSIYSKIIGDISPEVFDDLNKKCSYKVSGAEFSPSYNDMVYFCKSCDERLGADHINDESCYKCGITDGNFEVDVRRRWDGWKRMIYKNSFGYSFNTGLMSIVLGVFKTHGVKVSFSD
jgi:hypothetical protein